MEKQIFMKWKTIEEYPNYMVSDMGEVKSLKFGKERILKGIKDKDGYLCVGLSKEGKVKRFKVHRLVAQAFIPNSYNKPQIDHINTDRTDNRVENLRWVNTKENYNNPLTKIKHKRACTEETKLKISNANRGKQPRLGAVLSDDTKNKISQSLKKYYARVD